MVQVKQSIDKESSGPM